MRSESERDLTGKSYIAVFAVMPRKGRLKEEGTMDSISAYATALRLRREKEMGRPLVHLDQTESNPAQ